MFGFVVIGVFSGGDVVIFVVVVGMGVLMVNVFVVFGLLWDG